MPRTVLAFLLLCGTALCQQSRVEIPLIVSNAKTVIPRYHDGHSPPAGRLVGGVYRATAETEKLPVPAVIASEDYGQPLAQWQGGSTEAVRRSAVLQPIVRDVVIEGIGGLDGAPAENEGLADRHHGILLDASGATVDNLHVQGVPGTAGVFRRQTNPRSGPPMLWDRGVQVLRNLSAECVLRGFDFTAVDTQVSAVNVARFRDWGIRLGNAANAQQLHAWGGAGPAIWLAGNGCRAVQLYGENSPIGVLADCSESYLAGIRCHTCWERGLVVNGHVNRFAGLQITTDTVGVEVNDQYNELDGWIAVSGQGVGVVLNNTTGQELDLKLRMYGQDKATGLVAKRPLHYCTIDLFCVGGAVGADLSAGIGWGNVVRIRTKGTAQPVLLPKTWHESNEIVVNGKRLEAK